MKISAQISWMVTISLSLLILCCGDENTNEEEIAKIPVEVKIERFDRLLDEAKPADYANLKKNFGFWFPRESSDSLIDIIKADTLQQEIFTEIKKGFEDESDVHDGIESLFQHLKYYDPQFKEPRIIGVPSRVDYRNKVLVTDSVALIALDTYLGPTHHFYQGIPQYISKNLDRSQILPDLAAAYARNYILPKSRNTLLDEMIYYGKQLYFEDEMLPNVTEASKIGYTEDEFKWAEANEYEIWSYFIEKEILYSTDNSLPNRFINPAPFSKFYLQLDNQSPGMLGRFLGWKIVKAYMEKNDATLMDMLTTDPKTIFENSNYKPNK